MEIAPEVAEWHCNAGFLALAIPPRSGLLPYPQQQPPLLCIKTESEFQLGLRDVELEREFSTQAQNTEAANARGCFCGLLFIVSLWLETSRKGVDNGGEEEQK